MKHGMKVGKKRPERFFSWLDGTVFHKNLGLMKLSSADKRVVECVDHKLAKGKKPFFRAPEARRRTQRGK